MDDDYINASWIKTAGKFSFIASQGPLPQTVAKFWKMIAENKVTVIFALTKIEETDVNGKIMHFSIGIDMKYKTMRFLQLFVFQ